MGPHSSGVSLGCGLRKEASQGPGRIWAGGEGESGPLVSSRHQSDLGFYRSWLQRAVCSLGPASHTPGRGFSNSEEKLGPDVCKEQPR